MRGSKFSSVRDARHRCHPQPTDMPYRFQADAHLIRIDVFGTFTRGDLFALLDEVQAAEQSHTIVRDRMTVLLDVVDWQVRSSDFRDIGATRKATRFSNAFKSAMVAATPAQQGNARMFQLLNTHPQISFGIFDSVESASEWLRTT
jgi:hypothetical protein